MGIRSSSKRLESLRAISAGRCHSLRNRSGKWYVQCVDQASGKFIRISTGCSDYDAAQQFLETHKGRAVFTGDATASEKRLWKRIERARIRAKKKGLEFSITRDDVRHIVIRSGGYCEVTGAPFAGLGPFQPSIDRIDPSVGYVAGNIRLVCLITNTAMLHYGEDCFRQIAVAYCRKHDIFRS